MKENDFQTRNGPHFILILSIICTLAIVAFIEISVVRFTHGVLTYPLDDTFIHMAISKNLAFYHNWGINKYEFAFASSSPLYTVLLATFFYFFSTTAFIPLIINGIATIFLFYFLKKWLQKKQVSQYAQAVIFLLTIVVVPLPTLIISGMEHVMQCLFSFLLIYNFSEWINQNRSNQKQTLPFSLVVTAFLVATIRYEGLFLIAIISLILLYHKKFLSGFLLTAVCLLPLIILGIYSINKGGYFFPNSVLIKSDRLQFSLNGIIQFFSNTITQKLTLVRSDSGEAGTFKPGISLLSTQRLLIILPLAYFAFRKYIRETSFNYILLILIALTLLHLTFATTGWFYRYEAYLIYCSLIIVAVLIFQYGRNVVTEKSVTIKLVGLVLIFALAFPFVLRSAAALSRTKQACINIYEQQYQMGSFLKKYYDTTSVAVNDIGAVSFFTNGKNLDIWGLGTNEIAKSKIQKYWTPAFLDSVIKKRNIKIAVVYDSWFDEALLKKWSKVATWKIFNNVVCGDSVVSFYAISSSDAFTLKKNLEAYQSSLPGDVEVKYFTNE